MCPQNQSKWDVIFFSLVQTSPAPGPEHDGATAVHRHHKICYMTISNIKNKRSEAHYLGRYINLLCEGIQC